MVSYAKIYYIFLKKRRKQMANEQYEQKELTLGQIFSVIKKSLKLGLIYILITIVLATTVLFTIKSFTDTKVYSSAVSFTESTETTLSTMNYNKSNVVNKALNKANLSLDLSNDVVKNLTVTAIVPDNLSSEESFLPTSFTITLKYDKKLNLSSSEYTDLLNEITKELLNLFVVSSLPNETYSYDIENELNSVEYLQIADTLSSNIDYYYGLITSVTSSHQTAGDFSNPETGKTINNTISKLKSISNNVNNISQTIINKRVENINGLEDYLDWSISKAQSEVTYYTALQTEAKNGLEKYSNLLSSVSTGSGSNVYIYDDTGYLELYNKLMDITSNLASANKSLSVAQEYKNGLATAKNTDESVNTYVKNKLIEINNSLVSLINEYKVNAKAYNDVQYLSTEVKINKTAHSDTEGIIGMTVIILLNLSLVIIAYIVAYVQTYSKLKKAGYFNENPQENA